MSPRSMRVRGARSMRVDALFSAVDESGGIVAEEAEGGGDMTRPSWTARTWGRGTGTRRRSMFYNLEKNK